MCDPCKQYGSDHLYADFISAYLSQEIRVIHLLTLHFI